MQTRHTICIMAIFSTLLSSAFSPVLIGEDNQASPRATSRERSLTEEQRKKKAFQDELFVLAREGSDEAFLKIVEFTNSKDPEVRRMAARALSVSKHKDATELLLFLMGDKDKGVRGAVTLSLGYQGGEKAYKALVEVLENDESSEVKGRAAYAIGKFDTEESLKLLVSSLKSDLGTVRLNAAIALGRSGSKGAVEPLIEALRDPEDKVRKEALEGLHRLTGQKELYASSQKMSVEQGYEAWRGWWEENQDNFKVVKKPLRYYRSAKDWIERLDTDDDGCLDEKELQAGLDSFFGGR